MGVFNKLKKGKKSEEVEIEFNDTEESIKDYDTSESYAGVVDKSIDEDSNAIQSKTGKSSKKEKNSARLDSDTGTETPGFLSAKDKKELKEDTTSKEVDLTSEEQRQVLEREKLHELSEDMKYADTKKPLNYTIFKILNTTPITTLILYYIIFVMLNSIYLVFITKNTVLALLLGMVMSIFMVNSFVVKRGEMKRYLNNLFQLSGYATTLVHYIKSGNGITFAFNECWKSTEGDVKYDIRRTLSQLEEDASLDTESFKRYNSKNIIVFHRILTIWYLENSSNAGEMFSSVLKDLSAEVEKKNQLIEMKNTKAITLYMMAGIALGIPAISAFITGDNYDVFMSAVTSQYLLGVYYIIMAWTVIKINDSTTEANID